MRSATPASRRRGNCGGSVLVETVLVVLLLIVLLFGAVEYGWMFYCMHVVNNAAQVGARAYTRWGATEETVVAATEQALQEGGVNATPTVELSEEAVEGPPPMTLVTVSVSVAYGDLTIVDLALLPRPQTLQASVTMARDVN